MSQKNFRNDCRAYARGKGGTAHMRRFAKRVMVRMSRRINKDIQVAPAEARGPYGVPTASARKTRLGSSGVSV